MTLLFDHTRDLDLGVSRSESGIALFQKYDGRGDRGDFGRWHAVDIFSLNHFYKSIAFQYFS